MDSTGLQKQETLGATYMAAMRWHAVRALLMSIDGEVTASEMQMVGSGLLYCAVCRLRAAP